MIYADGLTKRFGDNTAVDNLTVHIRRGEVFGLLGPNGAGKTTTVRLLTALIAPTSGTATIDGLRLGEDDDALRQKIGILTETPGVYPRLSARQNLELFAELYDVDDVAGQVKRYLGMLDLWDRRDDPAGGFSKGMRQKLAIARALLHEPDVIYLDEPTSALDPASARIVREFIEELSGQGRTIIICTHNMDEADRLCDRLAIFRRRVLKLDDPDELRRSMYGESIRITLREVSDGIIDALEALPFVDHAERQDDPNQLVIALDNLTEHNPDIVRTIVEAGGDVIFIAEEKTSLEKVYLDVLDAAPDSTALPDAAVRQAQDES